MAAPERIALVEDGDMAEQCKGRRYEARFDPQAWINDYAVSVDPEGETEWDCTAFVANRPDRADIDKAIDRDRYWLDRDDVLMGDPAAPEWVRKWRGPFTITVEWADEPAGEADELGTLAESLGLPEDALDGAVHDAAQEETLDRLNATEGEDGQEDVLSAAERKASEVNNGGVRSQIEYLLEGLDREAVERLIRGGVR
jgi:hypothetical protein